MIVFNPDDYNKHPIQDNLYYDVIISNPSFIDMIDGFFKTMLISCKSEITLCIKGYNKRGISTPTVSGYIYKFRTEKDKILFKLKYNL